MLQNIEFARKYDLKGESVKFLTKFIKKIVTFSKIDERVKLKFGQFFKFFQIQLC